MLERSKCPLLSFQVHVVLLDPGYILEHTPLASRSLLISLYVHLHHSFIGQSNNKVLIFRQGAHYEAMSAKGGDQKDLEEFQKFSHIFSNCLPKPGLKILELESIYRFHE